MFLVARVSDVPGVVDHASQSAFGEPPSASFHEAMGESDFFATGLFHGGQQPRPVDVVTHEDRLVRGGSSSRATKHRPSARNHRRRRLERSKPGT